MKELFKIENPHWNNILYNYTQTRDVYKELEKQMAHKLILSIEGPRRVGKTVLMQQLMNYLINLNVPSIDIFYHSFDRYSQDPIKVLLEYEKIRERSLRVGKTYVFFDELQKVEDWQTSIKIIYDNYPNIKLIISGSSLRQSKKESLAGRIIEYFIKPLSFKEYLLFTGKENLLNVKPDLLVNEYNIYLFKLRPWQRVELLVHSHVLLHSGRTGNGQPGLVDQCLVARSTAAEPCEISTYFRAKSKRRKKQ